jgi:hypothetical protein
MLHSGSGYLTEKSRITMSNQERLHIGHLIKTIFEDSGMTVAEFARRIHTARPNVYSIFERYDIGVEQLVAISFALNHNFFDDIQLFCGLKSELLPACLNLSLHFEDLKSGKIKQIATLLNELSE